MDQKASLMLLKGLTAKSTGRWKVNCESRSSDFIASSNPETHVQQSMRKGRVVGKNHLKPRQFTVNVFKALWKFQIVN